MNDVETEQSENAVRQLIERVDQYNNIANISEIARRSFGNNAFDGILTMIGVLTGSYAAGLSDAHIVITTGLSTALAIMISGAWGAYLTESAERKKHLNELGQSTLSDLSHSRIGRAARFAALAVAVVDGLSPLAGALIVLSPFFFSRWYSNIQLVYLTSLTTALAALFGLGLWFGRVAKEKLIPFGLKTLLAGIISILIGSLLSAY